MCSSDLDVLPTRLKGRAKSIGNLDISEATSLNSLGQTASGSGFSLLGGLLHSSLLGGGLGSGLLGGLRRLHAIRIPPSVDFLKEYFFFYFRWISSGFRTLQKTW